MQDEEIIALYWQRDEAAIERTAQTYGPFLSGIAWQILRNRQDSEESVNDTYLKAWDAMPPHRPQRLAAFLARIVRQLSIDRLRGSTRQKRGGGGYAESIDELGECVPGGLTPAQQADLRLLGQTVSAYLRTLPERTRTVFVRRYFYLDPIRQIAAGCGMSEQAVKSLLHRTRIGLRDHLTQEGVL